MDSVDLYMPCGKSNEGLDRIKLLQICLHTFIKPDCKLKTNVNIYRFQCYEIFVLHNFLFDAIFTQNYAGESFETEFNPSEFVFFIFLKNQSDSFWFNPMNPNQVVNPN